MVTKHYINPKEFKPHDNETLSQAQKDYYFASQWRLMWWRLKRYKLAVYSLYFLIFLYIMVIAAEVFAPYNIDTYNTNYIYAPPQAVHFFHDGSFVGPFVYDYEAEVSLEELRWVYNETTSINKIRFFCYEDDYQGSRYKFWGLWEASFHLICPSPGKSMFLLGTDKLGHDLLSHIIYGARISLTIGLFGVAISFLLGITLGGLAGYYGGMVDNLIQRLIEIIRSFPQLPLWMALSAALPIAWSPVGIFFGLTIILALLDWPSLGRAVRSKLLSLREEDYCQAAQLLGAKPRTIIFRHLLPGFSSHLIASLTLSVPSMILGETALSFLGLGLRPPVISWGVLLNQSQNMSVVELFPWLILPIVPVILTVLAFNFLGDGLRDATATDSQ